MKALAEQIGDIDGVQIHGRVVGGGSHQCPSARD
jgi:hypothetical protein